MHINKRFDNDNYAVARDRCFEHCWFVCREKEQIQKFLDSLDWDALGTLKFVLDEYKYTNKKP